MHSRIMGIEEKDYVINNPDGLDFKLDYEEEIPHFADYTNDDTDLGEDFEWLVDTLNCHTGRPDLLIVDSKEFTIQFKKGFKEAYFKAAWDKLIKNLIGNQEAFDNFCGNKNQFGFAYTLKKLISEEFGFYVADGYSSYETLDDFIRRVDYDKEYKVFDSVDYHY